MVDTALESRGDLAGYDYLWRLSPDRWAWEFLRRNPVFRRDAASRSDDDLSRMMAPCGDVRLIRPRVRQTLAERWGLAFMADPALNAFDADVVWNRRAFPDQVEVTAIPRAPGERCEIWDRTVPICDITHITDYVGREYLLVRRNGFVAQVRATGVTIVGLDPVRLKLTISNFRGYERRVKLQKSAFELYRDDCDFTRPVWTKTTQVLRDGLIALDCMDKGMGRRRIAAVLYGEKHVEAEWNGPSLRHTMRYLVNKALALRDGGYLVELLGADPVANERDRRTPEPFGPS